MGNWWLAAPLGQYTCSWIMSRAVFCGDLIITQVTQAPCSPELVPCEFWHFLKLKSPLKGERFQNIRSPPHTWLHIESFNIINPSQTCANWNFVKIIWLLSTIFIIVKLFQFVFIDIFISHLVWELKFKNDHVGLSTNWPGNCQQCCESAPPAELGGEEERESA